MLEVHKESIIEFLLEFMGKQKDTGISIIDNQQLIEGDKLTKNDPQYYNKWYHDNLKEMLNNGSVHPNWELYRSEIIPLINMIPPNVTIIQRIINANCLFQIENADKLDNGFKTIKLRQIKPIPDTFTNNKGI